MGDNFSIKLIDRTEVVEYRDSSGIYRYDLGKKGRQWILYLPGSPAPSADAETLRVDRIKAYLSKIWWFGILPCKYSVAVEHKS